MHVLGYSILELAFCGFLATLPIVLVCKQKQTNYLKTKPATTIVAFLVLWAGILYGGDKPIKPKKVYRLGLLYDKKTDTYNPQGWSIWQRFDGGDMNEFIEGHVNED